MTQMVGRLRFRRARTTSVASLISVTTWRAPELDTVSARRDSGQT